MEFEYFLKTLSVKLIVNMYFAGLFKTNEILREVARVLAMRAIFDFNSMDQEDQVVYKLFLHLITLRGIIDDGTNLIRGIDVDFHTGSGNANSSPNTTSYSENSAFLNTGLGPNADSSSDDARLNQTCDADIQVGGVPATFMAAGPSTLNDEDLASLVQYLGSDDCTVNNNGSIGDAEHQISNHISEIISQIGRGTGNADTQIGREPATSMAAGSSVLNEEEDHAIVTEYLRPDGASVNNDDPIRDAEHQISNHMTEIISQIGRGIGNANNTLTSDQGEAVSLKYLVKGREYDTHNRRFSMTVRRMEFTFRPLGDKVRPLEWLKLAVNELLTHVVRGFGDDDIAGLTIENVEFPNKAIWVSFRKISQLSEHVIMEILKRILQSNASFFTNDRLILKVDILQPPKGSGFSAVAGRCVTFNEYSLSKNSIYVIEDDGRNICLAAALVVAVEFHNSDFQQSTLKKKFAHKAGKITLTQRAYQLCQEAGVDLSQGGGYEQIAEFQKHFDNFTIVVYCSRTGTERYFTGDLSSGRPRLNLIMENLHYNVILSLTGAFSTKYFCEWCSKRYSHSSRHAKCPYKCPCCHDSPPCAIDNTLSNCDSCNRSFRGKNCFDKHKLSKLCEKVQRCLKCMTHSWSSKKKPHVCGVKFCSACNKDKPIRHHCYMTPNKLSEDRRLDNEHNFLLVFYDLETRQTKQKAEGIYQHEPNLCISQQACHLCLQKDGDSADCPKCGVREKVFLGEDCVRRFLEHLAQMSKKFKVTTIAHNQSGFDGCFLLQELYNDFKRWGPQIIRNGSKILKIQCGNSLRFIDSLNFIQLPLSQFPKAFNLEDSKGYFPHYFNTLENENYVGCIPDIKFYGADLMKPSARDSFMRWHEEMRSSDYVFNMKEEIIKYCRMDVEILRRSCIKFRECFLKANKVDPLLECFTIASACNLVFRREFLTPDTIGILPQNGYRMRDNQSDIAIQWLLWEAHVNNIEIKHSDNGREVRLKENLLVDGFCAENNTVYEFYGCFWHGCELCFIDQVSHLSDKRDALFLRRENTLCKEGRIRNAGYNLVTMWECKFRKALQNDEELTKFVAGDKVTKQTPLVARDSFFGGRTNASKLYYKCEAGEKIKYYDVCSLYPYVNKYFKYPVGHPVVHIGSDACSRLDMNKIEGLIKCTVLPPQDLYHPVLPYRSNGRLTFPLCRSCVETRNQTECTHTPDERQLTGTYVADELRKALEKRYIIIDIYEVWEYNVVQYDPITKTGGLFSEYINRFLKLKQECSGWPSWCVSSEDKDRYLKMYKDREGLDLDPEKVSKNPGMRFVSKIMLNSFWGKFGQKENASQTQIINQPADLFKLVMNPALVVNNITILNEDVLLTTWERVEEDVTPMKSTNVAIAAYTTAAARLELYKYLDLLGERVLYYDTDSIFFVSKENEWEPPTGDFLGDLTDEMSDYGGFLDEFVSGGPKNYAYKFWNPREGKHDTVCKVKGVTLHYENSTRVNFDVIKSMVLENPDLQIDLTDTRIIRNSRFDVMTKYGTKKYSFQYTKRRRVNDSFDTVPYGFKTPT